jgi:hypothetical protein
MEKEYIDLIREKSFEELSGDELNTLSELCTTKEEFNALKRVFKGAEMFREENNSSTSVKVKQSLDAIFESRRKGGIRRIYPYFQVAAVAIILIMSYVFWENGQSKTDNYTVKKKQPEIEQNKPSQKNKKPSSEPEAMPVERNELLAKNDTESNNKQYVQPLRRDVVTSPTISISDQRLGQEVENVKDSDCPMSETNSVSFSVPPTRSVEPVFVHSDGIYAGRKKMAVSVSVNEQNNVLDLITPAF